MRYFVLVNSALVIMLLYLFFKDRKQKPNSKFDINKKSKPLDSSSFFKTEGKELNVLFNFNGETFDAYEVLGVPAGSPLDEVEKAYKKTDKNEFQKAAFDAIKKG